MKFFCRHLVVTAATLFIASSALAQSSGEFASETIDPGLVVSDAKKTVQFYTGAIGFKEIKGFSVPGDWTKDVGLTDGKTLDIHVLVLGDGKNATKLKVMEVPGARIKKEDTQYVTSHFGIRYLTVQVADLDAALTRLKTAGVKPETKNGVIALPEGFPKGVYLTLVRDPDGNLIELVGPKK
jgi:catechol 2,3-dioxygenase-like lactoylglutathione lyase family enzyme